MLRCFQLQGHHLDAKFVEAGTEPVDVTYGTSAEPSGFKPLDAALAELLHNDSQAQERLQGDLFCGQGNQGRGHQAPQTSACLSNGLTNGPALNPEPPHHIQQAGSGAASADVRQPLCLVSAALPAAGHMNTHAPKQQQTSMAMQSMQPLNPPLTEPMLANKPRVLVPARTAARQQGRFAKRAPAVTFSAPRPLSGPSGPSFPAPQGAGGLGGLFMTGNNKPFQVSTEGMARAARLLGLYEPDQDPPYESSGLKQQQDPLQPGDVPAGIFHFGCRRPVSISSDALNIERQWRDVALANDEDAAASSPPFQQQGSRAPHIGKAVEGLHHQDSPGMDVAIFAPVITPQAAEGCSAEPDWPQQQHAGYSRRPGMQRADATPGAPSESPQAMRGIAAEPAAPEQHCAGSNSEPDQAPEGAEQVARSGQGPFWGSAGIVMSSWGESQVMALPSLGHFEQNGQEGHHGQEESHHVNHHGQGEHQRSAEEGLHYGHDNNQSSAAAGLQYGQEECQLGAEAGLQHRLDEHPNSGGAGSPSQPAPEALVDLPGHAEPALDASPRYSSQSAELPSPQADTHRMHFVAATMEQPCATMDCEACERAAGEEQGNSQTRGLPDALDLKSPPHCIAEQTQLEAPDASENGRAEGLEQRSGVANGAQSPTAPAVSTTRTASAAATPGAEGPGAQEADSRPCHVTACMPSQLHASEAAVGMGSPQPVQHGAQRALANRSSSQNPFLQYKSVPATLAEEPEACEQEGSAVAEAPSTLLEALGQQGDPIGTLQQVSMPATLSEELEACEQEASAAAEAPPMQLKGLCQHSEQDGHAVAEAPPIPLEDLCKHDEPDQAAPAAAAPPTLLQELCQQDRPDQAASAAAQDTLRKLELDACQQGHAVTEAPRTLLEELCGVQEPVESGQALLAADSCSEEQADPEACEQLISSVTIAPTMQLEELCQHGELDQAVPAAVPHTLEELEPVGAMQSQPADTGAYEEYLCQQSEPHQGAPALVPDTLEELHTGQAVDASADEEQGSGQASMRGVKRSKSCAPHLPAPPPMPASLWGTASGKPFQASAGALHATQSLFGAGPELNPQGDVWKHPEPTAAQGAPAPMTEAADVQGMAAGSNPFSVWGTASGKPVTFSREQMQAAAALFGDDFPTGLTQAAAEPDAGATVTWSSGSGKALSTLKSLQISLSRAGANPSAAPHSLASAPAVPSEASAEVAKAAGPAFAEGHPGDVSKAAHVTPARGGEEPAAALPWQTASGKRMRVSLEGMAAAERVLRQMPALDHQLSLTTVQLPGITDLKSSRGPQAGAMSPATQVGQVGLALQNPIAEDVGELDPATPMPQQPAGRAGQLSSSSTGCKRRAAPGAQPPSGLPGQSRPRTGSSFKAPRKFMTPVSKFALQQGVRGNTPSRLQQASTPAAPRQPLHKLQGTMAGTLLAEAGCTDSTHLTHILSGTCCHPDLAILTLDSRAAPCHTIVDGNGERWGPAELTELLYAAGAEPQHCSEAWVANHFRWIVWKLACYERRLPQQLARRMLTVPVILDQLKYRYEREYGKGQRSVLKKILEQDERASRAMILCVAEVLRPEASAAQQGEELMQLEVTDGWYSVRATIDKPLSQLVASGALRPGMKVRVCGAELVSSQAQPVLEASRSCTLKLQCNDVHRIHPDARLGWTPHQTVLVPLSAVRPGGGLVPRTVVLLRRRFPALYRDTLSGGGHVRRTPRAKAAADRIAEAQAEKAEEAAVSQIRSEEQHHCMQILHDAKAGVAVPRGALLYARQFASGEGSDELMQAPAPGDAAEAARYQGDRQMWMQKRKEQLMQRHSPAQVTRSMRCLPLLVSAVLPKGAAGEEESSREALVEISNPIEDTEAFTEGSCYIVTDLTAPDRSRSSLPSAVLMWDTKRTLWEKIPPLEAQEAYTWHFQPRQSMCLAGIAESYPPGLFDFQGIVVGAGQAIRAGAYAQAHQWIFLTDGSCGPSEQHPDAPHIIAVHLQAQAEAVDFLTPAADVGSLASLRDLLMGGRDTANNIWQAHGNENTAVQLHSLQGFSKLATTEAPTSMQRLAQWALNNQAALQGMQARVHQLMDSR